MNAVVIAIAVMFILSLARVSVVLTLVISAIIGGLVAGLSLSDTVAAFNAGLGDGAEVALAYAVLGAFALALSKSGLPDLLAHKLIGLLGLEATQKQAKKVKFLLLFILLIAAICSQNVIPVHIAFIPVLVPPLLKVMNHLKLDRRAAACVLTLGLVGTYIFLPVGFGANFIPRLTMPRQRHAICPVQAVVLKQDNFVSPELIDEMPKWVAEFERVEVDANHWAVLSRPQEIAQYIQKFALKNN